MGYGCGYGCGDILDKRPCVSYKVRISPPYKDAGRVTPSGGASAAPAGGGSSPSRSGGLGKTRPTGIMTGTRVQSRWAGTARRGSCPRVTQSKAGPPASRKNALRCARSFEPSGLRAPSLSWEVAWLKLSGGVRSLPQVPWWNAERRARRKARAVLVRARRFTEQRLSAFRFPFRGALFPGRGAARSDALQNRDLR